MTAGERSEIAEFRAEMRSEMAALRSDVRSLNTRVDRWDGALTFIRAAATFVGLGGLAMFLAAISQARGL